MHKKPSHLLSLSSPHQITELWASRGLSHTSLAMSRGEYKICLILLLPVSVEQLFSEAMNQSEKKSTNWKTKKKKDKIIDI